MTTTLRSLRELRRYKHLFPPTRTRPTPKDDLGASTMVEALQTYAVASRYERPSTNFPNSKLRNRRIAG